MEEMLKQLGEAYLTSGPWGALAFGLGFTVRIYRTDYIQDKLPPYLKWAGWPQWVKFVIPFGLGIASSAIMAVMGGAMIWPAILTALISAVLATLGHKGTKAFGEAIDNRKIKEEPGYVPSKFRAVGSIVLPMSKAAKDARQKWQSKK